MKAKKTKKILFICTGNTCRSAMAEAYLKKKCADKKNSDIEIKSAGTSAIDGMPASKNTLSLGLEFAFDISSHLSTALTQDLIDSADIVIAMTENHRKYAMRISQNTDKYKFKLLLDFSPDGKTGDIVDPFGGDIETYRKCFLEMKPALDNIFDTILQD